MQQKMIQSQIYTTSSTIILDKIEGHMPINLVLLAYPNCIFIFINQTGVIGSIIKATAEHQISLRQVQEDYYEQQYEDKSQQMQNKQQHNKKRQKQADSPFIYQINTLFGSTQIQFYDLIMRRIAQLVFQHHKMKIEHQGQKTKIILNISILKANTEHFKANQQIYYDQIIEKVRKILPEVL